MKWKFFSVLAVLILALAACQGDGTDNNEGTDDNNVEQTRYNNNTGDGMTDRDNTMRRDSERGQDSNRNDNQENNQYDVAEEAADRITNEVDDIDQAYVLTTDNNAYVAAGLDVDRNERNDDTGNQNNDQQGDASISQNNNNDDANNQNNDRYDDELSDDVKEEISEIVKSVNNDIDNVYVSTNPEFFDLTNNYVDDVNEGRPVRGFFDQFGNMIERLFPENS
ncbi:YhcN/YlaJ family sporulation lipoprotein [Virgibacillus sp. NKC19-3]|uniref:YhcN/YlaJ family sporulation lipoprotein n=1 Tax=Virgibacillus saliphilus TaxID=2831674 RepID=UPI001C9B74BB|nr:YhcN/YlaJ family sporulation lipoprotein [Virgibacillus sp. NKC19-3]MBY7143007.1 YhcN/YlaJ family sporulation lipoprotein [Virgibacillus sp. NKC19-3]